MKFKLVVLGLIISVFFTACATNPENSTVDETPIVVFTSIIPQQYFVERIGGDLVEAIAMVEPGASPATYEPKPRQMVALSEAKLYFSIGVPFESAWMEKIADTNPNMKVIDTAVGIEKRAMDTAHSHEGEGEDEHDGGALDPHIWLSPALVKIQARNIYTALVALAPEHKDIFTQNLNDFIMDIEILETKMESTLSGVASKKFMVFHPSWGYFADEFGLEMIAIEVGGTEPSAAELAELITVAEHEGIKVVFAQPEFSTQDAATIAEAIDGEVILINPLAYDWLKNMQSVSDTFAEVLD